MTDIRTDAFTELGHAALDARHNGTPPERAEAARLTLAGKLPPLPPNVALMTETPWAEVAQVTISPKGKIAVLGIEPGGAKEIVEWQVIDRRWTSRVVDGTGAEMRVDHLHYPKGSEDAAYTVTRPDGKTRVHWGNWNFDFDETNGKIVEIYCCRDRSGQSCCFVVCSQGDVQAALLARRFRTGSDCIPGPQIAGDDQIKILGKFDDRIVILRIREGRQSVRIVDLVGSRCWVGCDSDWYDRILEGSVMERDDEVSFVGFRKEGQDEHWIAADAYLVSEGGETLIEEHVVPKDLFCLPSGRVLVAQWAHSSPSLTAVSRNSVSLRDWWDVHERTPAGVMGQIKQVVEIPGGLAVLAKSVTDGRNTAFCLSQRQDGSWSQDVVTSLSDTGDISRLRFWNRRLICDRVRADKRMLHVESVNPQVSEGGFVNIICGDLPLYTDLDRLVATEEGILSWHFVNGTFYVIRYEW